MKVFVPCLGLLTLENARFTGPAADKGVATLDYQMMIKQPETKALGVNPHSAC
jgi:hypothetical protein